MRISDWSSDVCSSDLEQPVRLVELAGAVIGEQAGAGLAVGGGVDVGAVFDQQLDVVPAVGQRGDPGERFAIVVDRAGFAAVFQEGLQHGGVQIGRAHV